MRQGREYPCLGGVRGGRLSRIVERAQCVRGGSILVWVGSGGGDYHASLEGLSARSGRSQPRVGKLLFESTKGCLLVTTQGRLLVTTKGRVLVTTEGRLLVTSKGRLLLTIEGRLLITTEGRLSVTTKGRLLVTTKGGLLVTTKGRLLVHN